MTIQVGTRVKAHKDFNFSVFNGPANAEELGTVQEVRQDALAEPEYYIVKWDGSPEETWDHSAQGDGVLSYGVVAAE